MSKTQDQITSSIMDSIQTKEPEKKRLVTLRKVLIIGALSLFIFSSAGLITLFILDTFEQLELLTLVRRNSTEIFYKLTFELLILAFIFFGVSYLFYRNTQLPFVKDRLKLILIILSAIFLFVSTGVIITQSNTFGLKRPIRNFHHNLKKIPHYPYYKNPDNF